VKRRAGVSRREALRALGVLGVSATTMRALAASPAEAQGPLPALGVHEFAADGLRRLFGARPIKDAGGVMTLTMPMIAENGAVVPVAIEISSPMTSAQHVKHVYLVAETNRIPVVARVTLSPESAEAYVGMNVRLGGTGDVRAIAELSDGTLLAVKRTVRVTVGGCGG
jgi:sulfur-oxidizing protein SoxY